METIGLIRTFNNMLTETRKTKYLDSSTGLPEELVLPDNTRKPGSNPPRAGDHVEDSPTVIAGSLEQIKLDIDLEGGLPDQNLEALMDGLTSAEMIKEKHDIFESTGHISYLEDAIKLARDLAVSTHPKEMRQLVLPPLVTLIERDFALRGRDECLGELVTLNEEIVAATPPEHPSYSTRLGVLGMWLARRYERFGALSDLEQAIKLGEQAVIATPKHYPGYASMSSNLGNMLGIRYWRLGDVKDLDQAIKWAEKAVAETHLDNPSCGSFLSNLGDRFGSRYNRLGDLKDLEQAIKYGEEAVAVIPPGHPNRAGCLDNLGRNIGSRYKRLGGLQDLEQSIKRCEESVAATPPGHPDRGRRLNSLSWNLESRYERLGELQDLELAIKYSEEAVIAAPLDYPGRLGFINSLVNRIMSKYQRLGRVEELQKAIELGKQAVAATTSENPDRAVFFNGFSGVLRTRFERLGELEDLDQAIKWSEKAVLATPLDDPNRTLFLCNLANITEVKHKRFGDIKDLEQAIKWSEEVVIAIPHNHPNRAECLNVLGSSLEVRYNLLRDLKDLERSIRLGEEAVASTPSGSPTRGGILNNLGNRTRARYKRLGDLQDLEQAIKWSGEAVASIPLNHLDRAGILSSMGNCLQNRYQQLGDLQDLEEAIRLAEEAVAVTPKEHTDRVKWLSNLGNMLESRYRRLGYLSDIEKATKLSEEVVMATPYDDPSRIGFLNNLSNTLGTRCGWSGDLEYLERALKWINEAIIATSHEHPDRLGLLTNLGNILEIRYDRLGDQKDLERSIEQSKEAAAATPPDHLGRGLVLNNLATRLILRYKQSNSTSEFYYILRICYEAWHCHISQPTIRIQAAHKAALLLVSRKMWQESSLLLEGAVKMLPKLSLRYLGRDDQEYHLSQFSRLTALTVSVAFQAGEEATYCLRLMELGRGILMGLTIDCRSDLSELESQHPEIFDKFHKLRTKLDSPLIGIEAENDKITSPYQQERHQRERATHEMEETLASIRELPGFEGFQFPPRSEDLMSMAGEGPIVIFNSTNLRSDAIIITSTAIKAVPLPKLLHASIGEKIGQIPQLVRGSRLTYRQRNEDIEEILQWLWDVAVEPVFDVLPETDDLLRIWWIGVGPLAMAPFHAAGYHSRDSTRNTISRAISSYIPTVKALSYARQKKLEILSKKEPRLLLVAVPTIPDQRSLTNAAIEAEDITNIVKGKAVTARLEHPSTAQVLKELPSYDAIHFACHGVSDPKRPSESHLLLCKDDGSESGALVVDKLTVGAISNTNIQHAQIAYLSACSTAENASTSLADESIYIASGFQLAGFSHVLATQWISNDDACRKVAGEFYRSLFSDQPNGGDQSHGRVSAAFHHAVKKLRDQNLRQPIKWASFIHTGA